MNLSIKTFFILLSISFLSNKAFSLTNYQMREICKNERRKFTCIKNLRIKKFNLIEGNRIEIPVIPYKNHNFKSQTLL